jgi:hypothetical protein
VLGLVVDLNLRELSICLIKQNQRADDARFAEWLLQGLSYEIVWSVVVRFNMPLVALRMIFEEEWRAGVRVNHRLR